MQDTLSSEEAVQTIEDVLWAFGERVGALWGWGYEFCMPEPHRWHAGTLHGYWLALAEEAEEMESKFDAARAALEALPIIDRIDVEPYEYVDDRGEDDRLVGEKWRFHFRPYVVYTHRRSRKRHDEVSTLTSVARLLTRRKPPMNASQDRSC
jgi:hypothetical protein